MSEYFDSRFIYQNGRKKVWRAITEYLQEHVSKDGVIIELGPGYCDFINQIQAKRKIAVDIDPIVKNYCDANVEFYNLNVSELSFPSDSVDVIFASNVLEHLDNKQLEILSSKLFDILKPGGKLILMQPNYFYAYREYWDDYTHIKAFSHRSLPDFLKSKNFKIETIMKRFLPFSFYSVLPKTYILTKIYLSLPIHPFAKQMLVIAKK
jgi:SAM-dependent methyltransferase